jgi:hypothetical protein
MVKNKGEIPAVVLGPAALEVAAMGEKTLLVAESMNF